MNPPQQPHTPAVHPQASSQPAASGSESRLSMLTPRIAVALNGPSDIPVAAPARYEIVVRNEDTINLSGIILQLDVPAGVSLKTLKPSHGQIDLEKAEDGSTLLSWTFEHLAGSKSAIAPLELVASSPKNFPVAMEWTMLPVAELAQIDVRAPRLELALEGPSEVKYGQANVYRLHIRNPGNAPATGVEVRLTAEQYGSSSSAVGNIAAGGEQTIDVELTFNQTGAISIAADATAAGNLASNTAIGVLVKRPELIAAVQAPSLVYHGSETPLQVSLSNRGDADAEDVTTVIELPESARVTSVPPGVRVDGRELTWTLANLAAGATQNIEIRMALSQAGESSSRVRCTDSQGNVASAAAITLVEAIADLTLLVIDPVAPAPIDAEVVYELHLTNRGSKPAQKVSVISQFSEGIEPLRADGPEYQVVPGQLFFEPIDSIAPGQTVKLKVFAKASGSGMHRFRAEVRTDDANMRLVQEESTKYMDTKQRIASPITGNVIR